jgi:hypothetical protein
MMPQLDFYMFFFFAAAVSFSFIFFSYLATELVCIVTLVQKGRRYKFINQFISESATYSTTNKKFFFNIFSFNVVVDYMLTTDHKKIGRRYKFINQFISESATYSTTNKKKFFNGFTYIIVFAFTCVLT